MTLRILQIAIEHEQDVVLARQRARQVATMVGFGTQEQTRIATAVSELARNAYEYAKGGKVEFMLEGQLPPQVLTIHIIDRGPGIAELKSILNGSYRSKTGMGVGIMGARRLLDQFDIHTDIGKGTHIILKKLLPEDGQRITAERLQQLIAHLPSPSHNVSLREMQTQNHELLGALAELKARQEELLQLTRELENTNRGVVALYAELDEQADHLRRADEMKSRFLSNMSHEFRTPLSSIRALSRLLLDRTDGDLTTEQEAQVNYILKGADDLSELVNDLLDLAKIEAGKVEIRPHEFDIEEMFGTLKGMLRPLLVSETVKLVFEKPTAMPLMQTDESKLSQIVRNFISNALKFTERGQVVVSATHLPDTQSVRFSVADTGIGITPENRDLIFEEFSQVESHLQRRIKGTGLGLPLCRKLSQLLGGFITLDTEPGVGSTFSVTVPIRYAVPGEQQPTAIDVPILKQQADLLPVLFVEDQLQMRMMYEKFLRNSRYQALTVPTIREAEAILQRVQPCAIVLDIMLNGGTSWHWLAELKGDDRRKSIPVIVASETDDRRKAIVLGANSYFIKPLFREELLRTLDALTVNAPLAPDDSRDVAEQDVP